MLFQRLALPMLLAIGFCWACRRVETHRDQNVVAGEVRSLVDLYAVHHSPPKYLTVKGKTYVNIRGMAPFYLTIPQLNSILFVTETKSSEIVLHIVDLASGQEIAIDGVLSGLGHGIGTGRKPGERGTDFIERVEGERLVIVSRSFDWSETIVVNLKARSVERVDTYDYDSGGRVTRRRTPPDRTRRWGDSGGQIDHQ